jgi:hypothetical protein
VPVALTLVVVWALLAVGLGRSAVPVWAALALGFSGALVAVSSLAFDGTLLGAVLFALALPAACRRYTSTASGSRPRGNTRSAVKPQPSSRQM